MRKFKIVDSGYLSCIGEGTNGEEITEEEYNTILSVIQSKPPRTETTDYRLREDLAWEEYEVEPPDPDPEIDDAEVYEILFGGAE
ncbi:MAG: hypothetical protein IKE76_02970 [Clostridia bacterium]|nr:hypothetical protein [Clostridia bacterium]